jgi:hypothetical protein
VVSKRKPRLNKLKNSSKKRLSKAPVVRQHLTISSTSKAKMRMMMKPAKKRRRARTIHPLMISLEQAVVVTLLSILLKEAQEDPKGRCRVRKNKAMMKKTSKILKKNLKMKIDNGRIDAICAKRQEAYYAVMDAHKLLIWLALVLKDPLKEIGIVRAVSSNSQGKGQLVVKPTNSISKHLEAVVVVDSHKC